MGGEFFGGGFGGGEKALRVDRHAIRLLTDKIVFYLQMPSSIAELFMSCNTSQC